MVTCVVWGCTNRGNSGNTKRQYYDIPKVIKHQGTDTERRSTERRNLWLTKINRENFNPDPSRRHYKVCSDHFITGKKADLYDFTNPDWAPSLKLGPVKPTSSPVIKSHSSKKRYERAKERQEKRKRVSAAESLLDLQSSATLDGEVLEITCDDIVTSTDSIETENDGHLTNMMRAELQRLTSENMELKEKLKETILSPESLKDDNKRVKHYTGIDYSTLMAVYNLVKDHITERTTSALTKFEKLMLVIMKLRLNLGLVDLAYRFKISQSCASKVFQNVIHVLFRRMECLILWPAREELWMSMPMEFRKYFGVRVSIIIDCFEIFIERPSNLLARAQTWSNYKHHNTAKFLIGITPQGAVSFLSKGWGGRASDKHVTEHCGLLDKLLPGDIVLADRGFDIKESVGLSCAEVKIPAFTRGKSQLSPIALETTRKIAHCRIHVERVIGLVRNKFTILQSKIPIDYLHSRSDCVPTIDKIVTVCCALSNLCESVVSFD